MISDDGKILSLLRLYSPRLWEGVINLILTPTDSVRPRQNPRPQIQRDWPRRWSAPHRYLHNRPNIRRVVRQQAPGSRAHPQLPCKWDNTNLPLIMSLQFKHGYSGLSRVYCLDTPHIHTNWQQLAVPCLTLEFSKCSVEPRGPPGNLIYPSGNSKDFRGISFLVGHIVII